MFRSDRNNTAIKHLKTIKTARGRELMVSGWWGLARKINYTGCVHVPSRPLLVFGAVWGVGVTFSWNVGRC
jgi:hypothetical protein